MPAGTVEVFLINAVGIKDTELFGKADPYAHLYCGSQKLRSNTASNQGSKPVWNQKFSFYIDDKVTDLRIVILNHNILTDDDELGSTTIPLAKVFADGKLPTTSYNVVRPSGRTQGEVRLSISFTPKVKSSQHAQQPGKPVQDVAGPYNASVHGSPYVPLPPEPVVKHDPLLGPDGYSKHSSSHGTKPESHSGNSILGGHAPYPPSEASVYPPSAYPPQHLDSGVSKNSFSSSSEGSSNGRFGPASPSRPADYSGSVYVQSPYGQGLPHASAPPHVSGYPPQPSLGTQNSHSSAYPPASLGSQNSHASTYPLPSPGAPTPAYPSVNTYGYDQLGGSFGGLNVSGENSQSGPYARYPGYHPPAGYSLEPVPSHSSHAPYDHSASGRTDNAPPPGYPPAGYPPPNSSSHGHVGYPPPGPYANYGYQAPPPSYYPGQLGPQQHHGPGDEGRRPSTEGYPPAPYYNAASAHYTPAGYPK